MNPYHPYEFVSSIPKTSITPKGTCTSKDKEEVVKEHSSGHWNRTVYLRKYYAKHNSLRLTHEMIFAVEFPSAIWPENDADDVWYSSYISTDLGQSFSISSGGLHYNSSWFNVHILNAFVSIRIVCNMCMVLDCWSHVSRVISLLAVVRRTCALAKAEPTSNNHSHSPRCKTFMQTANAHRLQIGAQPRDLRLDGASLAVRLAATAVPRCLLLCRLRWDVREPPRAAPNYSPSQ